MTSGAKLSAFIYRIFHEDLSSIYGTNTEVCHYGVVKWVENHANAKVDDNIVNIFRDTFINKTLSVLHIKLSLILNKTVQHNKMHMGALCNT